MPWLLSFLSAHLTAITIIGATAGAVASVESAAINTVTLVEKVEEKK